MEEFVRIGKYSVNKVRAMVLSNDEGRIAMAQGDFQGSEGIVSLCRLLVVDRLASRK